MCYALQLNLFSVNLNASKPKTPSKGTGSGHAFSPLLDHPGFGPSNRCPEAEDVGHDRFTWRIGWWCITEIKSDTGLILGSKSSKDSRVWQELNNTDDDDWVPCCKVKGECKKRDEGSDDGCPPAWHADQCECFKRRGKKPLPLRRGIGTKQQAIEMRAGAVERRLNAAARTRPSSSSRRMTGISITRAL